MATWRTRAITTRTPPSTSPGAGDPKGFNFVLENFATLSDSCEVYVGRDVRFAPLQAPVQLSNWAPELAWRVEVNEDFTEYTIFLRQDAYWHRPPLNVDEYPHLKGKHQVTAHDVEFTLDLIMDPQSNCGVTRSYLDKARLVEGARRLHDRVQMERDAVQFARVLDGAPRSCRSSSTATTKRARRIRPSPPPSSSTITGTTARRSAPSGAARIGS